jgi:hypothetical protein
MNLIERFKAWRRGDVTLDTGAKTGRLYTKPSNEGPGYHKMIAKGDCLVDAYITRADGTVEKIEIDNG